MPTCAGDKTERSQMNTLAKRKGNRTVCVCGGRGRGWWYGGETT